MNLFSDTDTFLATPTAARLYRDHVKDLPIVELYCHLDVASVAENRAFSNITELLLYGNLDLLELMRVCGVEERFITGNSSDFEKFRELCRIMPMLIGNSQYAFCHEALRRFFNCELTINSDNCETIWRRASDALTKRKLGAYDCLKASRIKTIFVAASPTDDLKPYEALGSLDKDMSILPVFCPDRCFDIGKRGALEYFSEIEKITSVSICDYDSFCQACRLLMDRFEAVGCKTACHNVSAAYSFTRPDPYHANLVIQKAISGMSAHITKEELSLWQTQLLRFFGSEYTKRHWIMQIGCSQSYGCELEAALKYISDQGLLPKVLICSDIFNASDICKRLSITDQGRSVQLKEAIGISDDIESLARKTALGSMVGLRNEIGGLGIEIAHKLFRQNACRVVGDWIDNGLCSEGAAAETIENICYKNAATYFEIN